MNGWVYAYYVLLVACFVISLFHLRYPVVRMLSLLLAASILTEIIVELIGTKKLGFFVVYHVFVVLEYSLITIILRAGIRDYRWRLIMGISIFIFAFLSLFYSFVMGRWQAFPGINITIESFLVICWCILSFFSISPDSEASIFQHPVFWLTLAFFIYFAASVSVNAFYNLLLANDTARARPFFAVLNSLSNYLLYIMLIKGVVCFRSNRISL
ncbi:hypothetical protein [Chitinophaga sp. 180180018-3]|uniref:hypothetical protein n=1 Tax=unclassified Chitinophaga TaxID=2619133 RepID=UPI0030CD82D2